ncbi:hypothetical protein A1O1_08859 [Capronia coronata CBS 617.96]|uniref:ABM domain-containing protein n=1 Tax=Capronia coronata CBS 617.96 TaxID=1182541 RepID=W9Y7U2_9EURO|nr:uncharacterized protein A1O1_08859 [Capronia coronata CBS 617.96]EXJ78459.1 hypothetical protein A1O1_08859 [Capronia coronata CBS 617.96]
MAPATEICFLPLKEGTNPEDTTGAVGQKFKEFFNTILAQDGCQRLYWGRQVEHPSICTLFIDWESVGHHEKFIASATYKPFTEELGTYLTGPPRLYHVHFDPHPPAVALVDDGPIATEFITVYFPPDYSAEDEKTFREVNMKNLLAAVAENAKGFKDSASGWVVEELDLPDGSGKAKVFVALAGWESVQAHLNFRETQSFKDNIHWLRGAKDLKTLAVFHVPAQEAHKS